MESSVSGIRHLPSAQREPRRWKNGGGVTYDVASFPEAADLDTFSWRVSIAEVASDGAFSLFPDIDRTMAILEGEGLALAVTGMEPFEVRRDHPPTAFPADRETFARLLSGPILDLNAMSRRSAFKNSMKVVEVAGVRSFSTGGHAVLVWCSGAGRIVCDMGIVTPNMHDAFVAQEPVTWHMRSEGSATALLIEFAPTA
ncbi:MAG: HutD family protein [Beijerinckiaceae bacterium]|nr:HutD family protein [Beijerinckiaceae bacterium]